MCDFQHLFGFQHPAASNPNEFAPPLRPARSMKILIDFLPILLFFATYKLVDIYTATGVLMAATVVQMAITYKLEGKLQMIHKITLGLILGFGGLTLALHDESFIKWKPTVLYVAMGLGLAVALWGFRKNFLKLLLGSQLDLPDAVWMRLNQIWIVYCFFMAALNAYVAVYFSTDAWVNFKLWGYVFPLAFIIGQGLYIAPHLKGEPEEPKA
jgi:intracellular septation protein